MSYFKKFLSGFICLSLFISATAFAENNIQVLSPIAPAGGLIIGIMLLSGARSEQANLQQSLNSVETWSHLPPGLDNGSRQSLIGSTVKYEQVVNGRVGIFTERLNTISDVHQFEIRRKALLIEGRARGFGVQTRSIRFLDGAGWAFIIGSVALGSTLFINGEAESQTQIPFEEVDVER